MSITLTRERPTAHEPTQTAVQARGLSHHEQQLDRTGVSRSAWRKGRQWVTIAVFIVATTVGVHIGLQGPGVSPVAPAAAPAVAVAPAVAGTLPGPPPAACRKRPGPRIPDLPRVRPRQLR